jgi:SP family arabinose:H+ symporter-like MFS transporter
MINAYVVLVCFVAAIGGFLFGFDLVIIAGAQLSVTEYFGISEGSLTHGMVLGSASIGCIFGPFLGMFLCDAIGRRRTLFVAAVLFGVSAIGTALAWDLISLFSMRAVGGLGVGLASVASPMYIIEIAPPKWRGALGLMFQLAVCIGAVAAVVVAYYLARGLPDQTNWRWMFGSEMVAVLAFAAALLFVPNSPRWLAEKGRNDEALGVMTRISGADRAHQELTEIRQSLDTETGTLGELFRPGMRTALLVGILLAFFNNWTGWSATAYYLTTLFQKAGFSETSSAIKQTIPVFLGNVILTIIAMWLVDRVGRRLLWNLCALAMIFATLLAGLVFQLDIKGPLVVLVIFGTAIPHAIGLGGLPWLMMSELYPTRVRAKAVAITTTVIWIGSFTAGLLFPKIVKLSEESALGTPAGAFWMYSVLCIFAVIFGLTLLPETKNKTLEEITQRWLSD